VLDALARGDVNALRRLAVDDGEFRDIVWPELPASRPERNLPLEYVWTDLRTKSEAGLASIVATYGGRRHRLEAVAFDGTTQYAGFLIHRRSTLQVRDEGGALRRFAVFGSMIEQDGRFKVFSYVTD
jgi:hypothetical protein